MSLRLRLTIWYAVLTGVVALLVGGITYAAHVRAHYEQIDQHLFEVASNHVSRTTSVNGTLDSPASLSTVTRIYDAGGTIIASTPQSDAAPSISPEQMLIEESEPPYDVLAQIVPIDTFAVSDLGGEFGLVESLDGERWRTFVVPMSETDGFIVTTSSLGELDESMEEFRRLVLALLLIGGLVTVSGGWLLASSALQPVDAITETANTLADSRILNRRVPVGREDELGRLAATFNRMLDNLEEAYQLQQRFVGDASHELRAPLTAICANLELLEQAAALPSEARQEAISEASQEARRLKRLVGDLLALAHADTGSHLTMKPVELDRVALEALHQCEALSKGQEIHIDKLQPAMVRGNADRLKQLLIILLDNALRYTSATGSIGVSVTRSQSSVRIVVRDTGVGIPKADLPHVFERFYRADPARSRDPGGTGLGLSIAKWIVEQHGGSIRIESQVQAGTTASVELPVSDQTPLSPT